MNRKQWLVVTIILALVFAAVLPAMAQNPTAEPTPVPLAASTQLYATADFLRANVRSGPSRLYTTIGQVRAGDALDITGRLASGTWLRVNFNGQEGWVSASLFEITGDLTTAPEAEAGPNAVLRDTASQTNTANLSIVKVITRLNGNLRAAPSGDADILTVIPFGTTLTVAARTEGNNWMQVTYDGKTGWISSGVLDFTQGNVANLPVSG